MVPGDLIRRVLRGARACGAAVPACAAAETLKRVEGDRVTETVPRQGVVRAQTPQAFRLDLLRRAHREAAAAGFVGTDDAQLVERLGEPVAWVEGVPLVAGLLFGYAVATSPFRYMAGKEDSEALGTYITVFLTAVAYILIVTLGREIGLDLAIGLAIIADVWLMREVASMRRQREAFVQETDIEDMFSGSI